MFIVVQRVQKNVTCHEYWTKAGNLKKSTSGKDRLLLGSGRNERLAVALQGSSKSLYSRLTHVTLKVENKNYSVNISSLSKKIHVCAMKILIAALLGKLDVLVQRKAAEAEQQYTENEIFTTIKKELKSDVAEARLRNFVVTAARPRNLKDGASFAYEGGKIHVHQDVSTPLTITSCDFNAKPLGSGAFGEVFAARLLTASGETPAAIKIAYEERDKKTIANEYNILAMLHSKGHLKGVQRAPYKVVDLNGGTGYITLRYQFSLERVGKEEELTPEQNKQCLKDLAQGLYHLHSNNIVHRDIKPANACQETSGEYSITDFGGACEKNQIDLGDPLGVCTKPAEVEDAAATMIALRYYQHLTASGEIKDLNAVLWAFSYIYAESTNDAIKREMKPFLLYLHGEVFQEVAELPEDHLVKKVLVELKSEPSGDFDMSTCLLTGEGLNHLKDEAVILNERHDIYCLGQTFLSLMDKQPGGVAAFGADPQNQTVVDMINSMVTLDLSARPSSEEVHAIFSRW